MIATLSLDILQELELKHFVSGNQKNLFIKAIK